MADAGSYYKLLEPGIKEKSQAPQRRAGCILGAICLIAVLCCVALAFILYQISHNINFVEKTKDTKLGLRPAINDYQQTPARGSVDVASGALKTSWPDPPPHDQVAKVARYIVHISDWASIATVSVAPRTEGFPFSNILSLSDGPVEESSGVPYMYLTPLDLTSHDLAKDSRASLSMSEAQSDYCHKNNYDPESPLCARILMTGNIVKVENGTKEEAFARNAVFTRHPEMQDWPLGHSWFFAKMNISHIYVLDFFGGAAEVDVDEYFKSNPF